MKRFAFYGRVSTEDQQDPTSSRNWQLARSRQVIEPAGGEIVAEFFDIGQSRSLPWKRRPEALRLLDSFRDPDRGFDAVVIGEPQRAFYGSQFGLTFPVFTHFGVGLWVPEVGGAVDPGSEAHDLVMSLYGGMSKGERTRIKTRVRSAMAAQAAIEGRFLGGRPPYGYRLVDAGPHPNPGKAATGQQLHRLSPDPIAAPVVRRIFDEFCAGAGLHRIASGLNADGIASPSAHDPARNSHRAKGHGKWAKSAVRAILANPRYTGFEVWNKQRKDEVLLDVEDVALGHQTKMRWNDPTAWVWSQDPMHEALVTPEQFDNAQTMFASTKRRAPRRPAEGRHYLLSGLLHCGVCGRRMQGQWNHGRAYYRCKYPTDYPDRSTDHPKSVYVKEAAVIPGLDGWLGSLFDDEHIDNTGEILAGVSEPDLDAEQREADLRKAITECDRKIERYRQLLDRDGDIDIAAKWIAEIRRERRALEAQLGQRVPGDRMTKEQVKALVAALRDIVDVLADAEPADKAELYDELGVTLEYNPDGTVAVKAQPRGVNVRVGGATCGPAPRDSIDADRVADCVSWDGRELRRGVVDQPHQAGLQRVRGDTLELTRAAVPTAQEGARSSVGVTEMLKSVASANVSCNVVPSNPYDSTTSPSSSRETSRPSCRRERVDSPTMSHALPSPYPATMSSSKVISTGASVASTESTTRRRADHQYGRPSDTPTWMSRQPGSSHPRTRRPSM
jgi:site-specific DNA recombinase